MPTWAQHVRYWETMKWRRGIVENILTMDRVGVWYLTDRAEIGLWIAREFRRLGYGGQVLRWIIESCPEPQMLANISPYNAGSQRLFMRAGFRLIQHTYELQPARSPSTAS